MISGNVHNAGVNNGVQAGVVITGGAAGDEPLRAHIRGHVVNTGVNTGVQVDTIVGPAADPAAAAASLC